jgi:multiple sugar transport system ATP-binding protein
MVARLDPATRVKMSAEAELWADVRSIHVFDPSSGANLTLPQRSGDSAATTVT